MSGGELNTWARLNAARAVEWDPVRRWERLGELRLAAAVALCVRYADCEALLAGASVPASRLDPGLVRQLGLEGAVVLDERLAFEVAARLPLAAERGRR